MSGSQIRFDDGAGYEQYMGYWSRLVGCAFLEWLAVPQGLRWLDVGCGNGAFTDLLIGTKEPSVVYGIDPSQAQLDFARTRSTSRLAEFQIGDAMALPFADDRFDVAVMPLVIFFVPDPKQGVREMARVVCPNGIVAAYAWDMIGGGFPYDLLHTEMRRLVADMPEPPSTDASRIEILQELWTGAGLVEVESREMTVTRTFADFEDYWTTIQLGPSVGPKLAAMTPDNTARLRKQLQANLPTDGAGTITCQARANAIKGRVR